LENIYYNYWKQKGGRKMKARTSKKTSTVILTLAIAVILVTAIIISIIMLTKPKQEQVGKVGNNGTTTQVASTGNFHENGWDASIVAEVRDGNVPIPVGFQYVSGTKDTGLVIKNEETGKLYVWIPYGNNTNYTEEQNANVEKIIQETFQNKENVMVNPDKLAEIQKYGGFYAGIDLVEDNSGNPAQNLMSSLAKLTEAQYTEADTQVAKQMEQSVSVDGSIMGREEVGQIAQFNFTNTNLQGNGNAGDLASTTTAGKSYRYVKKDTQAYLTTEFDTSKGKPKQTWWPFGPEYEGLTLYKGTKVEYGFDGGAVNQKSKWWTCIIHNNNKYYVRTLDLVEKKAKIYDWDLNPGAQLYPRFPDTKYYTDVDWAEEYTFKKDDEIHLVSIAKEAIRAYEIQVSGKPGYYYAKRWNASNS